MPMPFNKVKRIDASQVLAVLGVSRAREVRKHGCIVCGSSDALHAYSGGGCFCFSCGESWSNIDAVMHVRHLDAHGACVWLADAFGFTSDTGLPRSAPVSVVEHDGLSSLRDEGLVPASRSQMFAEVRDTLALTTQGAEYLHSRGLDLEMCAGLGVRSLDGASDWTCLLAKLRESYCAEELRHAGFHQLPWLGQAACIGFPYVLGSEVLAWRFRATDHRAAERAGKFRALRGVPIVAPFNIDAITPGAAIWITEAEIDCLALVSAGEVSVGLPGVCASGELLKALATACGDASRVLVATDNDKAGDDGASRIVAALRAAHGASWASAHVFRARPRLAKDVADLREAGAI